MTPGWNYTLAGYYRINGVSSNQGSDQWGLWSLTQEPRLASRSVVKGDTKGWQRFAVDIHNPLDEWTGWGGPPILTFGAEGNGYVEFDLELDNLALTHATKETGFAKNVVADLPKATIADPSFETFSTKAPYAAGWKLDIGSAQAINSSSAKAGHRVM